MNPLDDLHAEARRLQDDLNAQTEQRNREIEGAVILANAQMRASFRKYRRRALILLIACTAYQVALWLIFHFFP